MDPWLEGLWNAIKAALSNMASDWRVQEDSEKNIPDSSIPHVQLNLLSLTDLQSPNLGPKSASPGSSSATQPMPTSVEDVSLTTPPAETQHTDPGTSNAPSLSHSVPALSDLSLNVPSLPLPFLDVRLQEVDTVDMVRILFLSPSSYH